MRLVKILEHDYYMVEKDGIEVRILLETNDRTQKWKILAPLDHKIDPVEVNTIEEAMAAAGFIVGQLWTLKIVVNQIRERSQDALGVKP